MLKSLVIPLTFATLGAVGVAYAQGVASPRDPYTQGADTGARDPYSQGARTGKFDPYTEGANQSTKQELAPGVNAPRDPYTQGANTGARDPYTEGARSLNRDYPFDASSHVQDRRNPFFQGN
ncbi:hypothetical protein BJN34_30885 [Cupriavidus necator]|uniref:Hydroxyquinol 1,2-dioxygenase n=1 Tax=Cupriavidus necator TaxID=106590 RepID=A0A1U9V0E0_CUPNE|nr:hypothetical protein [Cupriavidus necator]AQV98279.1 hypothetical protein BJN34_30885 [Cupriavidus necator]